MTKEIKQYLDYLTKEINSDGYKNASLQEREAFCALMLIRIKFYQHERLVHLIVMMGFAVMTILSFAGALLNIAFLPLSVLLLSLTVPYVFHYHFLENSVQKMYKLYYEAVRHINIYIVN